MKRRETKTLNKLMFFCYKLGRLIAYTAYIVEYPTIYTVDSCAQAPVICKATFSLELKT